MTGQSSFNSNLSRFKVPNLTHHDDVWILTQERAQRSGEVQSDRFTLLDLINTLKVKLNWIFSSGDVLRWLVEFRQSRIQRGRFSRSRWTRHQHHAPGRVYRLLKRIQWNGFETQFRHVQLQVGFIQNTKNDLLPE